MADVTTLQTLRARKQGSLRQLAESLGYGASYAATLSDLLAGKTSKVSRQRENVLRVRLGLAPIPTKSAATIRLDPALQARFDALLQPKERRAACLRRLLDEREAAHLPPE